MGVYIKGMEMPMCCQDCLFNYHAVCVIATGTPKPHVEFNKRRDNCPLVPVPPHGDLIDRDEIKWVEEEFEERCHNDRWTVVEKIAYKAHVDKLPTIIPADKEAD